MLQTQHRAFLGLPLTRAPGWPLDRLSAMTAQLKACPKFSLLTSPRRRSILAGLRHPGEEMIVNQARGGHRRSERVSGGKREAEVLEPQSHFESRRLVLLIG